MGDPIGPEPWLLVLVFLLTCALRHLSRPPAPSDQLLRIRPATWVRGLVRAWMALLLGASLCVVAVAAFLPHLGLRVAIADALGVVVLLGAGKLLSGRVDLVATRRGLHFFGLRCPWDRLSPGRSGGVGIGPFAIRGGSVTGGIGVLLDPLWRIRPAEEQRLLLYHWWLGPPPRDRRLPLRVKPSSGALSACGRARDGATAAALRRGRRESAPRWAPGSPPPRPSARSRGGSRSSACCRSSRARSGRSR